MKTLKYIPLIKRNLKRYYNEDENIETFIELPSIHTEYINEKVNTFSQDLNEILKGLNKNYIYNLTFYLFIQTNDKSKIQIQPKP